MDKLKKDFHNLLQKLQITPSYLQFLTEKVDVQTIAWDAQTRTGTIVLKPTSLVPLKILLELEEKITKTSLNLTIKWQKQFNWYSEKKTVFDYLFFFLKEKAKFSAQLLVGFNINIIEAKKALIIALPNFPTFFPKKIEADLVAFLNERSIPITDITFQTAVLGAENKPFKPKNLESFWKKNQEIVKQTFIDSKKVEGKILNLEEIIYSGKHLFRILLETKNGTEQVNYYKNNENYDTDLLKSKQWVRFYGNRQNIEKRISFLADKFETIATTLPRYDKALKKRVELHVHTKMSALDGVGEVYDYLEYAQHWGHKAIAFTDHENVHIFPECDQLAQKFPDVKVIFGCEFEFFDSQVDVINHPIDQLLSEKSFIFIDIETTGLSVFFDEIIEFAAIVVKNGLVLSKQSFFVATKKNISSEIQSFTGIDLKKYNKEAIAQEVAFQKIKTILADHIIVAHNSAFDLAFLNQLFLKFGKEKISNTVIDNLALSRFLNEELTYHRLEKLAKFYKVRYDKFKAHRALYDAETLQIVFFSTLQRFAINNFKAIWKMNNHEKIYSKLFTRHLIVLVKNQTGLKDLYQLISLSHTKNLFKKPTLLKQDLEAVRKNFLIGAPCYNSEVFDAACYSATEILMEKISFYDYIEIQPPEVYHHLVAKKILTALQVKAVLQRIIKIAKKMNKLVVATGDVHYLEPEHYLYRDIFIFNKQLGGSYHPLYDFNQRVKRSPPQYLRTTEEMLAQFQFLGDSKLIEEIVIDNTNKIADLISPVSCFEKKFIMPKIRDDRLILEKIATQKLEEKYGKNLDKVLLQRFQRELNLVLKAQYATIYLISYYVTSYSLKEGYFFGSRGSVGSSFLAYCLDITEVNPLPPHYVCSQCFYFQWNSDTKYFSGFDLPAKKCPHCSLLLKKDGHEISFETFLGLKSENIPDIDLNFSSEFQERAQKYVVNFLTKELGKNKVFWTGTVNTVADKSAFGYYKSYLENKEIRTEAEHSELQKIIFYCSGIKKTTGQHPGGLILVPAKKDVHNFTPYNFPSNNKAVGNFTTHFDYHVLKNKLLKIDILGHDDPKGLGMLSASTGVALKTINLSDPKIIELFSDVSVLKLNSTKSPYKKIGTLGLPEFGTYFVMQILKEVKVSSFSNLIAVSGLAHGKNVWENNAKNLLKTNKQFTLNDVVSCRDDIFLFLTKKNVDKKFSYQIMQKVKKGKLLSNSELRTLEAAKVPEWYIDSCKKIKYLFPKAHAVAYVIMACRFAYFKIYYPHEFYATYFSIRCDVFDLTTIIQGKTEILAKKSQIQEKIKANFSNAKTKKIILSSKERKLVPIYEIALEMLERNVTMANIDLKLSDAINFKVHTINAQKLIIPPFIAIDRLGVELANKIVEEREKSKFLSQEDFMKRTKVNSTVFKILSSLGLFEKLSKKNVLTFDFY